MAFVLFAFSYADTPQDIAKGGVGNIPAVPTHSAGMVEFIVEFVLGSGDGMSVISWRRVQSLHFVEWEPDMMYEVYTGQYSFAHRKIGANFSHSLCTVCYTRYTGFCFTPCNPVAQHYPWSGEIAPQGRLSDPGCYVEAIAQPQ